MVAAHIARLYKKIVGIFPDGIIFITKKEIVERLKISVKTMELTFLD